MRTFTLVIWLAIGDIGDGYTEHRFEGFTRSECWEAARLAKEKLTKPWQGSGYMPTCIDKHPFIIDPYRR